MAITNYPGEGITLGAGSWRIVETETHYSVKTIDVPEGEDVDVYIQPIAHGQILLKVKHQGVSILAETNNFLIKCYGRRFNLAFSKPEDMLGLINFNQHDGHKPTTMNFKELGLRWIPKEYTTVTFPILENKRNETDPLNFSKNSRHFGD